MRRENSTIPTDWEAKWDPKLACMVWIREISLALKRKEAQFLSYPAHGPQTGLNGVDKRNVSCLQPIA
jgi:hypothetical protein